MKAILTFHSIDNLGSVLSYPPVLLDRLLAKLDQSDIPIMDLAEFLDPATQRGVVLTFDDGMLSVHSEALPILRAYGARAHVYITSDAIDDGDVWPRNSPDVPEFEMLGWKQIEDLHESGIRIESHTSTHPDMRKLSVAQMEEECDRVDDEIERRLGRRPENFAYPFGYHNATARDFCRDRYKSTVTTELRSISNQEDCAALPRLDTYYLQSPWLIDQVDGVVADLYMRFRWLMRTVRGSHCIASYDD